MSRAAVGVHVQAARITAVFTDANGHRHDIRTSPGRHSVAYDRVIGDAIGQVCAAAGAVPASLEHVVVGVSYASLDRSHLFRRRPTGPYWRDVLTTTLEFRLATRVSVAAAIELAALGESQSGAAGADGDFILVQTGTHVEAGLFAGDGRLRTGRVVGSRGDHRGIVTQLRPAIGPLLRSSGARLVVLAGPQLRSRALDLCADLRVALAQDGIRPLTVVPSGLAGDPVIAGALDVAASGRGVYAAELRLATPPMAR